MIKAERVRLEWALWNKQRTPDSFCRGMRYSNTRDLGFCGFTPTLIPVTTDFLSDYRYINRYPVTTIDALRWDKVTLDFSQHLIVAIAVLEQLQTLLSRDACLWDRHGGNILVDPGNPARPWQIDLETVFDMKTEKFRHQDQPMDLREIDHLLSAKTQRFPSRNPVNLQLDTVLLEIKKKLEWDPNLSEARQREIYSEMQSWGKPRDEQRKSVLPRFLGLFRTLQQRI